MQEVFKDIPGHEGMYQVSNLGRVKSFARLVNHWYSGNGEKERILKPQIGLTGYHVVTLYNSNKKTFKVHQLVAMAFLGHKLGGLKIVIDHIDFDRLNNKLDNLRLISVRENTNQKHMKSSSKYTGVGWDKHRKKWRSRININGKMKHLGRFTNEHEASMAYESALNKLL